MGCCQSADDVSSSTPPATVSSSSLLGNNTNNNEQTQRLSLPVSNALMIDTESWKKNFPPVTAQQLKEQRQEFWETSRVSGGDEQVWSGLQLIAESVNEDTAAMIRENVGLTPLQQETRDSVYCYDRFGFKYIIPMFVLHDPTILTPEELEKRAEAKLSSRLTEEERKLGQEPFNCRVRVSCVPNRDFKLTMRKIDSINTLMTVISRETAIPTECMAVFYSGRKLRKEVTFLKAGIAEKRYVQIFVNPTGAKAFREKARKQTDSSERKE